MIFKKQVWFSKKIGILEVMTIGKRKKIQCFKLTEVINEVPDDPEEYYRGNGFRRIREID